jgi:hypothetical protein
MKFLKGMALGFVGFFLFISLPVSGLCITLYNTILNSDFVIAEINKLNVTEVVRAYVNEQLYNQDSFYASAIDTTLTHEKIWIDQQISQTVSKSYEYLLGNSDILTFNFLLDEVKQNLSANLEKSILSSPPPEYLLLSQPEKDLYLANLKQQIQDTVPSHYMVEINQDLIGSDGMELLRQVKAGIQCFKTASIILIIFIALLILITAVILRKLWEIWRVLGIILILDGVFGGIFYFMFKLGMPYLIHTADLPVQVNSWFTVLINDFISPFGIFNLIILLVGGICLSVSFIIKDRRAVTSSLPPISNPSD